MASAAVRSVDGMETATAEATTAMKAAGVKTAAGMKAAASGTETAAASMKAASATVEAASATVEAASATMEAATAATVEAATSSAASGCLRQICGCHCYGGTREDRGKRHWEIDAASCSQHVLLHLVLTEVCRHVTREHLNNS